jgi:hypothetical protein
MEEEGHRMENDGLVFDSQHQEKILSSRRSIPALGSSEPPVLSVLDVKCPRFEDDQSLPKGIIAG